MSIFEVCGSFQTNRCVVFVQIKFLSCPLDNFFFFFFFLVYLLLRVLDIRIVFGGLWRRVCYATRRNEIGGKTNGTTNNLMVQDVEVTGNDLVLQDRARGNVNVRASVGDNDHSALENNIRAKRNISGNGQVVQLQNVGWVVEAGQKVVDLLEVVAQLDQRNSVEHALGVDRQLAVVERVEIRGNQEQIRSRFDGQETATGDVDTVGVVEVLDTGTDGSLELDHLLARLSGLVVDNDLQGELTVLDNTLDSLEVDPQVVGVEDLELLDRLEVLDVLGGNLGNFEQTDRTLVVDERTSLDIGSGLVSDLHEELGTRLDHVVEDTLVDGGTQIVDVGDKDVLLAVGDELVEESRVVERVEQVSVTGGIPVGNVAIGVAGGGEERVLVDARVSGLVEGQDLDVVGGVFLDNALGLVISVERVHEDEGDVDVLGLVQVL